MSTALTKVPGSLAQVAEAQGITPAEAFLNAKHVVLVDTSASMSMRDSRGSRSRYDVACEELAVLQKQHPGEMAIITFSDSAKFCPSGIPFYEGGGTDLADGLRFAKQIDEIPGVHFIVISDGEPNSERDALGVARTYKNRISTVYVGPETKDEGRSFLRRLADMCRGQTTTADRAKELAGTINQLLLTAGK